MTRCGKFFTNLSCVFEKDMRLWLSGRRGGSVHVRP